MWSLVYEILRFSVTKDLLGEDFTYCPRVFPIDGETKGTTGHETNFYYDHGFATGGSALRPRR